MAESPHWKVRCTHTVWYRLAWLAAKYRQFEAVGFAVVQAPAAVFAGKDLTAPVTRGDGAILGSWCYGWPAMFMFIARGFSSELPSKAERRRRLSWLVIIIIVALDVVSIIDVIF